MTVRASLLLLLSQLLIPGRFLFRRKKKIDAPLRHAAMDDIFESVRFIVATAAGLKPEWIAAWEHRAEVNLPPKFQPDQYLYPRAFDAAIDAKFTRALLYQNRWNSSINPLFETYDQENWAQMRAAIERSPANLAAIRESRLDVLRIDEASWMKRAVAGMQEAQEILRQAEHSEMPDHDVIAKATFQSLYSMLQLSETLLDGLRREALEE